MYSIYGLSYRDIVYVCRVVDASHVSVWCWVKELEGVGLEVEAKHRRTIAIDEARGGWISILCMGCYRR